MKSADKYVSDKKLASIKLGELISTKENSSRIFYDRNMILVNLISYGPLYTVQFRAVSEHILLRIPNQPSAEFQ